MHHLEEMQTRKGHKVHMGSKQEAFGAECAAIVRALETAD